MSEKLEGALGALLALCTFIYSAAYLITAYDGISVYVDLWVWQMAIFLICLYLFEFVLAVFCFLGALNSYGWEWYWALLFTAPTLPLILLGGFGAIIDKLKGRSKSNH
ncbi:hypothetical protein [Vibrio parahaemolyticus]|uniref:hypothetical protein n=2 Tax=Vibrio parahaemolyticus TaxID=670 RepID=UPI00039B6EED|nr:hypothetical protein [Vibrio parahaemolyticus]MCZ5860002.1 hypothetical protein [Vibrio parahaemolyticus]MDF4619768.1 hypothetical protein [Vibrio parahaemolyticus]MDF5494778.1 hypothetical protein [Vibrio parahaemolyticus]QGT89708.1 hypothetical protein GNY17_01860 [Vibrio parahaemolyticus]QPM85991.1 hypothetical protein I5M77_04735 [Vibrio parahaemolyticus]